MSKIDPTIIPGDRVRLRPWSLNGRMLGSSWYRGGVEFTVTETNDGLHDRAPWVRGDPGNLGVYIPDLEVIG